MADLIIDATTSTLSGIQNYTNITVRNGGILYVTDYTGTDPAGTLELNATGTILVDATSQIF